MKLISNRHAILLTYTEHNPESISPHHGGNCYITSVISKAQSIC